MSYCPNCGEEIARDDDMFCAKCGHRLEGGGPPAEPRAEAPAEKPVQAAAPDEKPMRGAAPDDILSLIAQAKEGADARREAERHTAAAEEADTARRYDTAPAQGVSLFEEPPPAPAQGRSLFEEPPPAPAQGRSLFEEPPPVPAQRQDLSARPFAPVGGVNLFETGGQPSGFAPNAAPDLFAGQGATQQFGAAPPPYPPAAPRQMPPRGPAPQAAPAQRPPMPPPARGGQAPNVQWAGRQAGPQFPQQPRPQGAPPFGQTAAPGLFGEAAPPQQFGARGAGGYQPPPVAVPRREEPRRGGRTAVKVIVFALVFLILTAGVTVGMLMFLNQPGNAVNDFRSALLSGDEAKVEGLVTFGPGLDGGDVDVAPLCGAFASEEEADRLKQWLLTPSEAEVRYPAITLEESELFLFIKQYRVHVSAVSLLAPGAAPGTVARLNGVDYQGAAEAGGVLYAGLVPGRYECVLIPPGGDAATIETISLPGIFGVDGPNAIDGSLLRSTVTVTNCLSDDAIIYVNDAPIQERPVGGSVTVPSVALGSTIRISLTQDGVQMESTVVYSDPAVTTLSFGGYTNSAGAGTSAAPPPEPAPAMSAEEINALMLTFYTSYLQCINDQNMSPLQRATESAAAELTARVTSEANSTRLFEFRGVECDTATLTTGVENGENVIEFEMTFSYNHKPRTSGSFTAGSNRQSVQLVYRGGQWLVNRMDML